jgi:hypothetical protein
VQIFRGFLWAGYEMAHGGQCLVAWDYVERPLSFGGLGVKDLKLMGHALQLRWLWLQRSDPTKPWASMSVYEDVATLAFFRASDMVVVRNIAFLGRAVARGPRYPGAGTGPAGDYASTAQA